ncbi:hypothetical protein BDB00DRAFT_421459 [Zychaea mexicana]|uniref:uncharacterized protein n=1 Tax=Zychaea mexicana TaxID=64656 RepID=UPI0022FF3D7F|nr:uncharacterized protein BDB00DRAFT_421459 [Zychaea mexicana]KAI9492710.1 hypothetical protein BDB00DRAFT_421459 [Zychaea mexicana]
MRLFCYFLLPILTHPASFILTKKKHILIFLILFFAVFYPSLTSTSLAFPLIEIPFPPFVHISCEIRTLPLTLSTHNVLFLFSFFNISYSVKQSKFTYRTFALLTTCYRAMCADTHIYHSMRSYYIQKTQGHPIEMQFIDLMTS